MTLAISSIWVLVSGAAPLTVDEVLQDARTHRAEIVAASARAEAFEQVPGMVGALPEPMLMGGVDHLPFSLMGASYSVQVQQDFPISGLLGARTRAARAEGRAERTRTRVVTLDVELGALRAFLMLAEAQRMEQVLAELQGLAQGVLSAARARISAGQGVASDVLRAESNLARLDAEHQAAKFDVEAAASMLAAARGSQAQRAPDAPWCSLEVPTSEPSAATGLIEQALAARPELVAMKGRVEASQARVDEMRAMYWPMGFVRAGYASTMTDGPGAMLMVGVSLPLWREKLRSGVGEAEAMASMGSAEVEAMQVMISGDVAAARGRVQARRARYLALRDTVAPRSKDAAALTRDAYIGGQVDLVSVLDAFRELGEAKMQLALAEVQLAWAWAELGRALGTVGVKAW